MIDNAIYGAFDPICEAEIVTGGVYVPSRNARFASYSDRVKMLSLAGCAVYDDDNYQDTERSDIEYNAREAVRLCRDTAGVIPESVKNYIAYRGLYLSSMSETETIADLRARVSEHRLTHILGTAETSERLAKVFGVSPGKARLAGLLHDCAKYMTDDELLSYADVSGGDDEEKAVPGLLHAPVGAYLAKTRYGVCDDEVLSAIRRHCVGGENMSVMDAVVDVSDFIEPNRNYFKGLELTRRLAETDIYAALAMSARQSGNYMKSMNYKIHSASEKMIYQIEHGGNANG